MRRRLSVDDRRSELIETVLRLIGDGDWDSVTMTEIAARAQISKGLLYHYFADKPALYLAAVRAAAAELSEATRPDPSLPLSQRLRAALTAHLDWIDDHASAYRAVLRGGLSGDPQVQAIVESSRTEAVARMSAGWAGHPLTPGVRVALRGWVGFLEGASLDWLATQDLQRDELVELLAALIPAAIRAADSGSPAIRTQNHVPH